MAKSVRVASRIVIIALVMFASACGGSSPTSPTSVAQNVAPAPAAPAPTTGTLNGQVRNSLNAPVANASVRVLDGSASGQAATTGADGRYSLPGLPLGTVTLSVTASGYEESRATAPVTAAGTFDFVINFPLYSQSGVGNNVFNLPPQVRRLRIQGRYTSSSSNFIVWCGTQLVVNELLGTFWGPTSYDGTHQIQSAGCLLEFRSSTGVSWTLTEVR